MVFPEFEFDFDGVDDICIINDDNNNNNKVKAEKVSFEEKKSNTKLSYSLLPVYIVFSLL